MHADQRIEVLVEKPCGGSVRLVNYAFWADASMRCDERRWPGEEPGRVTLVKIDVGQAASAGMDFLQATKPGSLQGRYD